MVWVLGVVGDFDVEEWEESFFAELLGSECFKKALSILYPSCVDGVDRVAPGIRRNVAIELSKCEWEASGVLYPHECLVNEYESCVKEIQNSEKLWTSYSGNFRRTSTFCYEYLVPFEKDQILGLYSNISKAYAAFYDSVKHNNDEAAYFGKQANDNLKDMLSLVNQLVLQWGDFSEKSEKQLRRFEETLNARMEVGLEAIAQNQNQAQSKVSSLLDLVNEAVRDVVNDALPSVSKDIEELTIKNHNMYLSLENASQDYFRTFSKELALIISEAKQLALAYLHQQETLNGLIQHEVLEMFSVLRSEFELSLYSLSDSVDVRTTEILDRLEDRLENEMTNYITSIENYMASINDTISQISLLANATNLMFHTLASSMSLLRGFNPWRYLTIQAVTRLGNAVWLFLVLLTAFRWGSFLFLIPCALLLLLTTYVSSYGSHQDTYYG